MANGSLHAPGRQMTAGIRSDNGAHRPTAGEEMDMTDMDISMVQTETHPAHETPASGFRVPQRASRRRAGSALLIVIGTLALISVFAAVYISVGRTDRRAANAVRARKDLQDISQSFGEALSTVIGDDRLDAYVQYDGVSGEAFGRRELTDAPYTDWTRRSESNFTDGRDLFTPKGGPYSIGGLNQDTDFSVPSDSWLASTTPVYLGDPGFQNEFRPFSTYQPFNSNYPNAKNFLDNRDWLQISNFAPDGRFVNLFNLRPNPAFGDASSVGRFDAESGVGVSTYADGRSVRRMSSYLSLLKKAEEADPGSMIQAFDPADGIWVPGLNVPDPSIVSGVDLFNTPAVWTMYQRFMFMPINQPFITLNRDGLISTWSDPDFPAYQYADADGDGMADSRWFELTAARDARDGNSSSPRTDIEVMYDRKDYRYFIAARAVDLSSMVNVNTATDLLVPPTKEYRLGLTPADVDLRRLLTMQDPASDFTASGNFLPLSYAQLHRPYIGEVGVEPRFGPWRPDQVSGWEQRNLNRNVTDYWLYKHEFDRTTTGDLRKLENNSTSMLVGRYAYDALRQGIMLGSSLSNDYEGFDFTYQSPNSRQHLLQYERDPSDITTIPQPISAKLRIDQFREVGQLDPTNLGTSWSRGTEFGSGLYGMDDLVELLSFYGLNDPEVTTRLEKVTTGRYKSPMSGAMNDALQTQRLGPLMSNRPLSLDRYQHGLVMIDINRDPSTPPSSEDSVLREVNGRVSFNSMAHFALTPRTKLTTISGSVALVPTDVIEDPSIPQAMTQLTAAPDLKGVVSNADQLFGVYSGALAGELNTPNGFFADPTYWPSDVTLASGNVASTLFYGHRGPELALRIAAHSAVNLADLGDADTEPTAATLILDNTLRSNLIDNYTGENPNDPMYLNYPGRAQNHVFDPGRDNLPSNQFTGIQNHRQAVNVFGIEPMPILTEVSSMYVYVDADTGNGGDTDFTADIPRLLGNRIVVPRERMKVTIRGDADPSNPDFKMQVLAFQLTNPWDFPITLGNPGNNNRMGFIDENNGNNTNLRFDYYIEYGGRFFKLGEFLEFNPPDNRYGDISDPSSPGADSPITMTNRAFQYRSVVLAAQSSRVFYAIAEGRFDNQDGSRDVDADWLKELLDSESNADEFAANGPGLDGQNWTGPAEEWVNSQFTGTIHGAIHIHQFDPTTGDLVEQDGFHDLFASPLAPVYADGDRKHDLAQARLWRKIKGTLEENEDASPPNGAIRENLIQNDMLVDRLSASDGSFFRRTLASGDTDINGTYGYDPDLYDRTEAARVGVRNDNFGFSIVRWATVRRGDNPTAAEVHSKGKVASWMMSSRDGSLNTIESNDPFGPDAVTLDIEDFLDKPLDELDPDPRVFAREKPDYEISRSFSRMFRNIVGRAGREAIQTIVRRPRRKIDLTTRPSPAGIDMNIRFPGLPLGSNRLGETLHEAGQSALVPELFVDAFLFNDAPRLADLLLAWGIGPTYTPDPTRGANDFSFDDDLEGKRWITLPEAIAFGLGYQSVTTYNASESLAESVWYNAFATKKDQLFDNGHLVIDNYVSYVNKDTNTPPTFDPVGDLPRGTGVPMALGVIDQVRANAPIKRVTDPLSPTPAEQLELALSRATFGKVNINTAPIEVLRLLPGLTPSRATYNGSTGRTNEWWGKDFGNTNLPALNNPALSSGSFDDLAENPDVASAIVAYRDRTYGIPNTAARADPYLVNFYDNGPYNLEPTDPILMSKNLRGEFPLVTPLANNSSAPVDRGAMTGIDGIRSTPGFGSLGELLAVRVDPEFKTLDSDRWKMLRQLSIQQYGFDEVASGIEGEVTIMSQLFGGDDTGLTKDDYAEKISMANAVLNTISVRSDYFAVWFVVQGYQESDVANLRPEDPLVPSIRKRFLMVVDRTNVIKPGDKPKILVFKELPI